MKRIPTIGMALGAALVLCGGAFAEDAEIKIGLAASLTGPYAPYAEVEGARCMADKLNKAGEGPKITLLVEDTRSEPQLSVSIAQKFLDPAIGHGDRAGVRFGFDRRPMAEPSQRNRAGLADQILSEIEDLVGPCRYGVWNRHRALPWWSTGDMDLMKNLMKKYSEGSCMILQISTK